MPPRDMTNYRKVDLKRKIYTRGNASKRNFKRFKRTPKYIRDNPENKVAREKEKLDAYHFTDSSDEDNANELGMGLELSDLPFLNEQDHAENQQQLIALTQDSVRPLFTSSEQYDESKLLEALQELKLKSFRPLQKETIKRILFGRSTLFISSTGSGKSLCYQLPALLYWRYRKYMTIVVSPLISLMEDQMNNFPSSCLKAVSLHSNHSLIQRRRSIEQLVNGEAQVVFISPEAIVGGLLNLDDLKNFPPVGFVCIDEAHCLSEWSHNFRPAYLQFFKILHDSMKIKTFLGLTATATRATSFAISRTLVINPETDVIGTTTIPENLILSVSYETNKEKALIDLLKLPTFRIMTSIIVYCNRRDDTEIVATRIRTAMQDYATLVEVPERKRRQPEAVAASNNDSMNESTRSNDSNSSNSSDKAHLKLTWNTEAYHAGLSSDCRKRIQRQFIKGEIRVVVATIAFGMGINKANVRAIIHYDMPSSFESYVQEIGRAGRDGKPAQCHMFLKADKTDVFYQQRNIYSSVTERENLKKLTEYIFKPCICSKVLNPEVSEKLEKLNKIDQHEIKCEHQTAFIDKPVEPKSANDNSDSDSDDEIGIIFNDENTSTLPTSKRENDQGVAERPSPKKFYRKSIVKKHRRCDGHERTFSIDEATQEMNLKPESIITLICQLQKSYPQLKIVLQTPIKSTCNLFCYSGPAKMDSLAMSNPLIKTALFKYKQQQLKTNGGQGGLSSIETPNKLTFDIIEIAAAQGIPSLDAIRMLKKTEWELVEKTGRFRRSQVRVTFEGNAFHLTAVGDLESEELKEIDTFLFDFSRLYEKIEREKVQKVFDTLKKHCISFDQMTDKRVRLETSSNLKAALNSYFDRKPIENSTANFDRDNLINSNGESKHQLSKLNEELIRKNARSFVSTHREELTPRIIARIFQGISTPRFPAEVWGMNRRWWRIHTDVDFLKLEQVIRLELNNKAQMK